MKEIEEEEKTKEIEDTQRLATNTEWVKFGDVLELYFVGKETLACGVGCQIRFYEINHQVEVIYKANNRNTGDGVQCMAGHRSLSMFAFAEKAYNPRVLIVAYPSFEQITIIRDGAQSGYLAIVFSEMEYLVTLSSLPNFEITVWSWKSGEKLASQNSNITSMQQAIRCSLSSPLFVCQMAFESKTLLVWDVYMCSKKCILKRTEVKLPETAMMPCAFVWSTEGILYISDGMADIYMIDTDKSVSLAISWPGETGTNVPCLAWFKGGMVISGPNSEVKHFKKGSKGWSETWSARPKYHIRRLAAYSPKEYLFGMTQRAELVQWIMDSGHSEPLFNRLQNYGTHFTDFCLLNPAGDNIVTLDSNGDVIVWDKVTGNIVGATSFGKGAILVMVANPILPYLGLGKPSGTVEFLSMYDPAKPFQLALIRLCEEDVDSIEFNTSGHLAVVATLTVAQFFVIRMHPGERIEVLAHVIGNMPLVQFVMMDQPGEIQLFGIVKTTNCCKAGNRMLHFTLEIKTWKFKLNGLMVMMNTYTALRSNPLGKRNCYAIPHRSRQLQVLKMPLFAKNSKIVEAIPSGHQLRRYNMSVDERHLVTFGMDGLVIVRKTGKRECVAMVMPHHRNGCGVLKAVVDPIGQNIITLGKNGTLVRSSILMEPDLNKLNVLRYNHTSIDINKLLTLAGKPVPASHEGKTWLQIQEDAKVEQETMQCSAQKKKMLQEFADLRRKTVALLEKNSTNPPEEQLPLIAFDLDIETRERNERLAKIEREETTTRTYAICAAQDKLCQRIKEKCWDVIDVKGRCIKAISCNFEVENYALHPIDDTLDAKLDNIIQRRKLEAEISKSDTFYPWIPASTSALQADLAKGPELINETDRYLESLLDEEEQQADNAIEETPESPYVWSGSASHNYVEVSPYHCSQFVCSTYNQVKEEIVLVKKVTQDLRLWFNKQFNDVFAQKEREMYLLAERNDRLRYVLSELNDKETCIVDPDWHSYEKPNTIITVEDNEVCVTPYISPSAQIILDEIAAEKEARRLAELADNFRELALIKMMDGVLEIRWEDTIKKDIPLPKCMIDRQPEEWNEDDLRAVKDYEEKVAFLMTERERYKKMLESEFEKLSSTVKEGIKKFDTRLADLYLLKLKVESCIDQENLKVLRYRLHCQKRIELDRKEAEIKLKIAKSEEGTENLKGEIQVLQAQMLDCRLFWDTLTTKEKNLDKNFRKDFPDISQVIHDQLYKAYKRRPKTNQRAFTSATMINELAKCCITNEKPTYLQSECLDYLKALDNLDQNCNAPSNVNEDLWLTLCRVRRLKIEADLRIKAGALELAEADATISLFQKKLVSSVLIQTSKLQAQLKAINQEKIEMAVNMQIQLVMKQGLVEVPLTGRLSDFDEVVLIKRFNIEDVNKDIVKAGMKKLKAITDTMNFHRGIICQEYEHKSMVMEIEDLRDHLRTVELFKVTKDIQEILRRRYKGLPDEKGSITAAYEKEFQRLKDYYKRVFLELEEEIKEVDKQIQEKTKDNEKLDRAIVDLNVNVNDQNLKRDLKFEEREAKAADRRIAAVMERSRLCSQIQMQHSEIMVLQTELELLRLRTYPTLKYNTLDNMY